MMMDLRIWDTKSSVNMMGVIHTPDELKANYPSQTDGDCVLQYNSPNIVGGIDSLHQLAMIFNVEEIGTPQEILDNILIAMSAPPEPSAEERIASAMEFQNLMSI